MKKILFVLLLCNEFLAAQPIVPGAYIGPLTINPAVLSASLTSGGGSIPSTLSSTTMPVTTAQWHFSGQNNNGGSASEDWVYSLVATDKKEIIAVGYREWNDCSSIERYRPIIFKLDHNGKLVWSKPIVEDCVHPVASTYDFSSSSTPTPGSEYTSGAFFSSVTKAADGYIAIGRGGGGMFIVEVDDNGNFINGTPIDIKPPATPTYPSSLTLSSPTADGVSVAVDPNTNSAKNLIVGGYIRGTGFNGAGILELNYVSGYWQLNKSFYDGNGASTGDGATGSNIVKIITKHLPGTSSGSYEIFACGGVSSTYDNNIITGVSNADGHVFVSTDYYRTFDKDIWILKMDNNMTSTSIKEDKYNKSNIIIGGYDLNTINTTTYPYQEVGPVTARNMDASSPHDIKWYDGTGTLHLSDATQYLNAINNKNELAYDMIFAQDGNLAVITHVNVIGTNFKNGMDATAGLVVTNGSITAAPQYDEYVDGDAFLLKIDPSKIGNTSSDPSLIAAKNVGHFSGKDFFMQIKQDLEGHYIIAGSTADKYSSTDINLPDPLYAEDNAFIVCTDNSFPGTGDIWRRSFLTHDTRATEVGPSATHDNEEDMNCVFALDVTADGGYVIGGNNRNNGDDFSITKFAPLHQQLMEQGIGGSYETFGGTTVPAIHDITGTETWNSDMTIASWVVVENGAALDIYSTTSSPITIKFAASDQLYDYWNAPDNFASGGGLYGCGILVKPGGVLHVWNANLKGISITGEHNVWDGIVAQGSPVDPSVYPYAPQAYVTLAGVTIEDARVGVYAADDYRAYFKYPATVSGAMTGYNYTSHYDGTYLLGGAKIETNDSWSGAHTKFVNCRYGAEFENYIWLYNASTLTNTQFISTAAGMGDICFYTDQYGDLLPSNTYINEWQWSNLNVYGCSFTCDLSFPGYLRPIGIEATASGLYAYNSVGYSGNTFSNLSQGIQINEGCPSLVAVDYITNNLFDNNLVGVNASGKIYNMLIRYNEFNLANSTYGYGINLAGCHGYDVSYNSFDRSSTGTPTWGYGGILANNGTPYNETINNNHFNHIQLATIADQQNGDAIAGTGLQYRCNVYDYNVDNIDMISSIASTLTYPCVIRPIQGNCTGSIYDPAGNQFYNPCMYRDLDADAYVTEGVLYNNNRSSSVYDPLTCNTSNYTNFPCLTFGSSPDSTDACPFGHTYTRPAHITGLTDLATLDETISETTDAATLVQLQGQHDDLVGYLARYYALNGMFDSAAALFASYNMYREALPFYLTAGDYQSASTMYQNLPLASDDDKLFAWEAGIAINLFSNGKTWFDIDSASLDSMKRLVQYNKASGYMAGGTAALLGAAPVTWPIPVLDTASLDSILAISDRNVDTSGGGGGAKSSHGTVSKEKKSSNFSAYPNPTSGAFTIVTSTSGEFTLFTLLGQQLGTYPILSGKTDIELPRNLASGIYLGRFRSNNGDTPKEIRVVYQP